MIERHVTFNVLPGRVQEFEEYFVQRYRPAMAETQGFVRAELLRYTEDTTKLQMVLRFESLEAAAAWRNSEAHQALKPGLKALYDVSELKVYDVLA